MGLDDEEEDDEEEEDEEEEEDDEDEEEEIVFPFFLLLSFLFDRARNRDNIDVDSVGIDCKSEVLLPLNP